MPANKAAAMKFVYGDATVDDLEGRLAASSQMIRDLLEEAGSPEEISVPPVAVSLCKF